MRGVCSRRRILAWTHTVPTLPRSTPLTVETRRGRFRHGEEDSIRRFGAKIGPPPGAYDLDAAEERPDAFPRDKRGPCPHGFPGARDHGLWSAGIKTGAAYFGFSFPATFAAPTAGTNH